MTYFDTATGAMLPFESSTPDRCTCHSIHETSDGRSYSDYMLGVNCGYCEWRADEYQEYDRLEQLTPAERLAEHRAHLWWRATNTGYMGYGSTRPRHRFFGWSESPF
jgi:hypothetical protein